MTFEALWADLAPVGRSASSGGYFRQPFGAAEREAHAWFREEAARRDLRLETDGFGNTVAWWDSPGGGDRDAVLTGSHLDSVDDGGAYDGPLGVVSALAAVDRLRERGHTPSRSIGIGVFVAEEGSRFGIACLGSRLATGGLAAADAGRLTDPRGVPLAEAWAAADLDPSRGSSLLDGVGCFVELHVEQGRDLVHRDVPIGVAGGIWPHGRFRFDLAGQANHAGSTRMADRADPMLTYAATALAANEVARRAGQRATFGRVEVAPNGTNAIPSRVTAWLDARCETEQELTDLLATLEAQARDRAGRDGTTLAVTHESVSGAVAFDRDLTAQVIAGREWPVIPTMAGHDAGILAAAGIPSTMLFVRNPSGISHAPQEHAPMVDCLAGMQALADTLARLAG